jgi:hypothetical protein
VGVWAKIQHLPLEPLLCAASSAPSSCPHGIGHQLRTPCSLTRQLTPQAPPGTGTPHYSNNAGRVSCAATRQHPRNCNVPTRLLLLLLHLDLSPLGLPPLRRRIPFLRYWDQMLSTALYKDPTTSESSFPKAGYFHPLSLRPPPPQHHHHSLLDCLCCQRARSSRYPFPCLRICTLLVLERGRKGGRKGGRECECVSE